MDKIDWSKWKSSMVTLEVYSYDDKMLTMKVPRELAENYRDSLFCKGDKDWISVYNKFVDYLEENISQYTSGERMAAYTVITNSLPVILIVERGHVWSEQINRIRREK